MVETKLIVIHDLGRNLNPIGYNFKSPILKPSRFTIQTIGRLLAESKVSNMLEVYEKDASYRVKLNLSNYKKNFEELWWEQNPEVVLPYADPILESDISLSTPENPNDLIPDKAPDSEENKVNESAGSDTAILTDPNSDAVTDAKLEGDITDPPLSEGAGTSDEMVENKNIVPPSANEENAEPSGDAPIEVTKDVDAAVINEPTDNVTPAEIAVNTDKEVDEVVAPVETATPKPEEHPIKSKTPTKHFNSSKAGKKPATEDDAVPSTES